MGNTMLECLFGNPHRDMNIFYNVLKVNREETRRPISV